MLATSAPLQVAVLAAGKGSRMQSPLAKVLHPLFGKPLVSWVLRAVQPLVPQHVWVITGHQAEAVEAHLATCRHATSLPVACVRQTQQLGTGHAVQQLPPPAWEGAMLVLAGDVPLVTTETLASLWHTWQQAPTPPAVTVLAAYVDDPTGYGRVCLNDAGQPIAIIEEKDATPEQKALTLVNSGVYILHGAQVQPLLAQLTNNNQQAELYLTDIVALAAQAGLVTQLAILPTASDMTGVNTPVQLAECHKLMSQRAIAYAQANGVMVLDPATTWLSDEVTLAGGVQVLPGCMLQGNVQVGAASVIGPYCVLKGNTTVGERCQVMQSLLSDATVGDNGLVGPFAHMHKGASTGDNVKVGNFVEMKNASIGADSFISHLAYVGDATLGHSVNWGAGSITANYNPITGAKQHTHVGDRSAVGSNCVLVAPLALPHDVSVAAGTVVTKPVPPEALVIGRARQTHLEGWVAQQRAKLPTAQPQGGCPVT